MNTESRDARRWSAYERLAADASASESERRQARARLDDLRRRYPNGLPRERTYTRGTTSGWGNGWWHGGARPGGWDESAREEHQRRAEQERRAEAVRRQRADVKRVPRWETSGTLRELHESTSEWSDEERWRFNEQRVRLTGSSRAVDL